MTTLKTDTVLTVSLLRGSPRGEWWRLGLTGVGAALGTVFALAALTVTAIGTRYGGGGITSYTNDLLNYPSQRTGVVASLLLLLLPVLAFIGQCARIGALRRERRMAALRLAGATPGQVRRIAALETGMVSALGSLAGLGGFLVLRAWLATDQPETSWPDGPVRLLTWPTEVQVPWAAMLLMTAVVPALATLEARFTLRRAGEHPLGVAAGVRRRTGRRPNGLLPWVWAPVALVAAVGLQLLNIFVIGYDGSGSHRGSVLGTYQLITAAAVALFAAGLLFGAAGLAVVTGRLAARSGRPELLIAGERLLADPWAAARSHAAVMFAVVLGVGFAGVRRVMLDYLAAPRPFPLVPYSRSHLAFLHGGLTIAGIAIAILAAVTAAGLVVGAIESVITRRRTLATLTATGVPRGVLVRAALLEAALPLVPTVVLASACAMTITGSWWAATDMHVSAPLPVLEPLLTAAGLLTAALLATAASLPLLRRTVHPAQLRHE
ncbi:FtsX-like permease family protein [Streptomyces sp. NPDC026673]|uniref:FtsX-like permease family protein n=1 Tax=Streptomyces sp. NPDC026673 TaxID=3155724 RepID=UPI0033D1E48A